MILISRYLLAICVLLGNTSQAQSVAGKGKFILQDENALGLFKARYQRGDTGVIRQVQSLILAADTILKGDTYAVTFKKTKLAPSGDPHDYVSQAPYWWPDSTKPNGVPYIRKDGHINPERYLLHDNSQLVAMAASVKKLGAAYYFTGQEKYAKKAATLLQVWFVDTLTRMKPNLDYGQYIPGICDGRGIGIIETAGLMSIPDALAMMQGSTSINGNLTTGVKTWYNAYLHWLMNSKNGKEEHSQINNHGTFYDLQVADYAMFTGEDSIAQREIRQTTIARIDQQFTPDGAQPLELVRTKSWSYSIFNLTAWCKLAVLADRLGIDLWHQQTTDGKGIEKTIRYLIPFAQKDKTWKYEQIEAFEQEGFDFLVTRAAPHYKEWPAPAADDLNLMFY